MMHMYRVSGMTCEACAQKVKIALELLKEIEKVSVDLKSSEVTVMMSRHVSDQEINDALNKAGHYSLHVKGHESALKEKQITLRQYWPLVLIFLYIIGATLGGSMAGGWAMSKSMPFFMGMFFLVFAFFKLLDVPAFATSFRSYDPIAKKISGYGYVYPFIEVLLGVMLLTQFMVGLASLVTLIILSTTTYGVVRSLLNKKKIQCACLGVVFDLPLTHITIVENTIMILMAIMMLV